MVKVLTPLTPVEVALVNHLCAKITITKLLGGKIPSCVSVTAVTNIVHIAGWDEEVVYTSKKTSLLHYFHMTVEYM